MDADASTLVLIATAIVLAVAGGLFYLHLRKPKEEPVHYFRCPGCRRKLRYHARQVGHKGMCNHCKEEWVFPAIPRSRR